MGTRVVAVFLALALQAAADPIVLDQEFAPAQSNGPETVGGTFSRMIWTQTFTVGVAGTLDRVEVHIQRFNDPGVLEVYIQTILPDGSPPLARVGSVYSPLASSILALALVQPASISTSPAWHSVDFAAAGLALSVGDKLGLTLRTIPTSAGTYGWDRLQSINYPGGQAYNRDHREPEDMFFRTYVDIAKVPEPSLPSLLVLALTALWFRRRGVSNSGSPTR